MGIQNRLWPYQGKAVSIIAITGWSGTGKTTLAKEMVRGGRDFFKVRCTDDLIHLGWSEASEAASHWFDEPGELIIEGIAVPRALRKWRARNPDQPPPVEQLIVLTKIHKEIPPGAVAQGKGHDTVLAELADWLGPVMVRQ